MAKLENHSPLSEFPHDGHFCPHPRLVQIVSHGGELLALNDHGELFARSPSSKDFNQGPNHQPAFIWRKVMGPDMPSTRDFGGPQEA